MNVNSGNQAVPQNDFPSSSKAVVAIVVASYKAATSRGKKAKLSFTSISPAQDIPNFPNNVVNILDG